MRRRSLPAAALACAAVGLLIGASGLFGPSATPAPVAGTVGASNAAVRALDCPGGDVVASFMPGERLFAIARSPDSAWVAVRASASGYEQVWVRVESIDSPPIIILPTADCVAPELQR